MKRSRRLGETVVDLIVDVAVVGFCEEFAFFCIPTKMNTMTRILVIVIILV